MDQKLCIAIALLISLGAVCGFYILTSRDEIEPLVSFLTAYLNMLLVEYLKHTRNVARGSVEGYKISYYSWVLSTNTSVFLIINVHVDS